MNEHANASTTLKDIDTTESQSTADLKSTMSEDVANYLREHPQFLVENRELLLDIQVLLSTAGVVSLTQIQSEQYREKIKQLKTQLESLVGNARKNEDIYKAYAQLNIDVAQTTDFESLMQALSKGLVKVLGLEKLQLVLLNSELMPSNIVLSEIQQHSIFDKKLAKTNFYLGRLGKLEREALFPDAQAESVALVKLGENKAFGLLAIASKDPLHFTPEMDTMLIDFLRINLNLHIPKLG
jgi:uncharacterized protein YigA (DUF484 family)